MAVHELSDKPECWGTNPSPSQEAEYECHTCPTRWSCSAERVKPLDTPSALHVQIGGAHYAGKKIQPVEYIHANRLNFLEGCVVKRITRWRDKPAADRFQDLEKIKHEIDLLIEMEKRHG